MQFTKLLVLVIILMVGCKKSYQDAAPVHPTHPIMQYIDLNGREAGFNISQHLDLDGDGKRDFSFVALHIGDPLLKREIIQFSATSAADRFLLVNNEDKTPTFNRGDLIGNSGVPGYNWFEVSAVPLSEKIIEDQKLPYWTGNWNNVLHKYLAMQLRKNGEVYNGWFELSMDIAKEKIILYKAAICKEAQVTVRAGY